MLPAFATNLPDIVKIVIIAYLGVMLINAGLRRLGLVNYTTKGQ